ncbi:MAG: FtsH protease activity modulator HflK [Thermoanaerobaculales bacterium]|nr:FtsH protease activity modulator HflK [Thermoanaerobaculales bacterium]
MSEEPRIIDIDFKNRPPLKVLILLPLVILGLVLMGNIFYTIEPEEAGVILRFGSYNRITQPGLHFKMPYPIEQLAKVPIQRQLKQEFGFRTAEAGIKTRYSSASFDSESLMLTGDLNVAVVEWIAQYRVTDPYLYLFKVRNREKTFHDMTEAVMRAVVGDRSVDEVITIGRQEIEDQVRTHLQELCNQYEIGITVDQVVLQDVNPPDQVKPSFNEVNQAEQERERAINDARAEYNRVIPQARGEALRTVEQAEGYAMNRVNRAKGDASLFDDVLAAYRRAPEVTRRRLYLETMEQIFPKAGKKLILDSDLEGVLPLLSLAKEVKQ